ncbi:MAG TPA: Hsp70 family protein [Burkholderiales bacterium]|nr:Hsp70 family protein [Burkholderiales bacterium]
MDRRSVIGIDLGTTNCALARRDASAPDEHRPIEVQPIAQLVNPGEVAERALLPSFLYVPGAMDFPEGTTRLPWDARPRYIVGELARNRGAENAARVVASAKSWLSHGGAQRTAPILPWGAPEEVTKLSPVEASAEYLRHLAAAYDAAGAPGEALARQEVLLTVPASFDEEARELTLRAAQSAGFEQVTLLEEPQAAFYAWLDAEGEHWRRRIRVGDLVLVCDIGGGTTDFSLIAVSEREGDLALERVAVGDHILLGGDNMDLALARLVQQRLEADGHRLDTRQLQSLWHQCRAAKEALLGDPAAAERPLTLLGSGSRLIGGTIKTSLSREDVDRTLLEGFFPVVAASEMPARARRVGLQELGLPYAADPGITRHLARFLSRQASAAAEFPVRRGKSGLACPTHLLFNGGVLKAPALQGRIVSVLNRWLADEGFDPVTVLGAADLDHAVARGAVYYGMARRGRGIRIRSGASRSYYIGIESAMPAVPGLPAPLKALCVVPFGMEEGTSTRIAQREFGLVVGEPAEFRFLSSTVRKDPAGALIEDWGDELEELGPLEVTLELPGREDTVVPVALESHVSEVGTLELWCVAREASHRWKLELNIREPAA